MEDDSDASSSAATDASDPALASPPTPPNEMSEEFKREFKAAADRYEMETKENELHVNLGSLDKPDVLEDMMGNRSWLNVSAYLQKALGFHREEAHDAVAYPDGDDPPDPTDMPRAHPELYVLPRRMHVLELLNIDELEEAQKYFNEEIFEPTRTANLTPHLNNLITELRNTIFRDGAAAQLNLPEERCMTSRHIRDYLRVYFPTLKRSDEVAASMAMSKKQLHSTWPFGEHIFDYNYRCLVCHKPIDFHSAPDNRMVEHLHDDCPAMTPGVRHRLPRRNRPPWPRQPRPPPPADDDDDAAAADPQQQDDDE